MSILRPRDYKVRRGRAADLESQAWKERYHLSARKARLLTDAFMCRLSLCKSDEARELLLGIEDKGDRT